MERESVLICKYCGKVIDPLYDNFTHEVERKGTEVTHEGDYHSECFINSIIRDLEELEYEVIRPREEPSKSEKKEDLQINPEIIGDAVDLFKNLSSIIPSTKPEPKPVDPKSIVAKEQSKQNDTKKRETKPSKNTNKK